MQDKQNLAPQPPKGGVLKDKFLKQKNLIENFLQKNIKSISPKLEEVMKYACLNGGKRLRGILFLNTFEAISQKDSETLIPIASGIECIHTMSLIHDDLPCMDNDDFRRGKASAHKAFNEAEALLAGDALLADGLAMIFKAFLTSPPLGGWGAFEIIIEAIGSLGMTGGQSLDINTKNISNIKQIEEIHKYKTGALLKASILCGAITANANDFQIKALKNYGEKIGLIFQIRDDILDIDKQEEITYLRFMTKEKAEELILELLIQAKNYLKEININSQALFEIADLIAKRDF